MTASRETGATSPIVFVADSRGRDVGWAVVTGPLSDRAAHRQLAQLGAAGYRFLGATGYFEFPARRVADERDYGDLCEAWLHCFRRGEDVLPAGAPAARIALADFTDYRMIRPAPRLARKEYDLLYVGASFDWKRAAKNWELAAAVLPRLARELDLEVLVIGAPDEEFGPAPGVGFLPFQPWGRFLDLLRRARALFVPNVTDPAPRVMAQALCLDVPLAVNRAILGGWHYVTPRSGVFFDGEDDVAGAVTGCLGASLSPRAVFASGYGPQRAGRRLLDLLRPLDPSLDESSHLTLAPVPPRGSPLTPLAESGWIYS